MRDFVLVQAWSQHSSRKTSSSLVESRLVGHVSSEVDGRQRGPHSTMRPRWAHTISTGNGCLRQVNAWPWQCDEIQAINNVTPQTAEDFIPIMTVHAPMLLNSQNSHQYHLWPAQIRVHIPCYGGWTNARRLHVRRVIQSTYPLYIETQNGNIWQPYVIITGQPKFRYLTTDNTQWSDSEYNVDILYVLSTIMWQIECDAEATHSDIPYGTTKYPVVSRAVVSEVSSTDVWIAKVGSFFNTGRPGPGPAKRQKPESTPVPGLTNNTLNTVAHIKR